MSNNKVWSLEFCPICEDVKKKLNEIGIEFEEGKCDDLINGKDTNFKATRRFVKNKKVAPLILIDGEFIESDIILSPHFKI